MATERRKPTNAILRGIVTSGRLMEYALDDLVEKGPGYTLTDCDCKRLKTMQAAWNSRIGNLRKTLMALDSNAA